MTVPSFIIFGAVVAYLLLLLAFITKDYIIGLISSMAIIVVGVYIAIYNVDTINNLLTQSFATISIAIGAYVFINASKEKIEEWI